MILETKRLILRPWEESDAENLFKYASHPMYKCNVVLNIYVYIDRRGKYSAQGPRH